MTTFISYRKPNKVYINTEDIGEMQDNNNLHIFFKKLIKHIHGYKKNHNNLQITLKNKEKIILLRYKDLFKNIKGLEPIKKDYYHYQAKRLAYSATASSLAILMAVLVKYKKNDEPQITKPTFSYMAQEEMEKQITRNKEVLLAQKAELERKQAEIEERLAHTYSVNVSFKPDFDNRVLINVNNEYGQIIKKFANKYGLDYNLICAMATQERGKHSEVMDKGGAIGLMQIQVSANPDGTEIPVITFEDGTPKEETFTFYKDNYKTLEGNIEAGCAILNNLLHYNFNDNLFASLYAYNFGPGNVRRALNKQAERTNSSKELLLEDKENYDWNARLLPDDPRMDYRAMVLQFINTDQIKYLDKNGTELTVILNNTYNQAVAKTK